ncbi:Protein C44C1.1 [Aphelenchoides avenae]|nr:Protein C44C1.1 [Aphelenchus avenae]
MSSTAAKAVLVLDSTVSLVVGLALFFAPSAIGDFVLQRTTDGVHWHLIRCVGGQILAASIFFYRFRSRTPETRTACFILRILACIFGLLLLFHSKSVHPNLIEAQVRKGLIYAGFGTIAIYIVLLLASGWPVGDCYHKERRIGNALYQLDSIASIAIGMAWMTCPHWLLHRQVRVEMDESHELCGRLMGALFVASYLISTHALHWKKPADRALAAEARALCCIFILAAQVWSQVAYEKDWSGNHWIGISLFSSWTVIAIIYRIATLFDKSSASKDNKRE